MSSLSLGWVVDGGCVGWDGLMVVLSRWWFHVVLMTTHETRGRCTFFGGPIFFKKGWFNLSWFLSFCLRSSQAEVGEDSQEHLWGAKPRRFFFFGEMDIP